LGRALAVSPGVVIRTFDDDAVVFNPFSWETHLLNPAAALVLELVAAGVCTEHSVCDALLEVLEETERPRAAEHARNLLNELVSLRLLVEQAPSAG
jgi:PqqD family protein of HPr-rel-A system